MTIETRLQAIERVIGSWRDGVTPEDSAIGMISNYSYEARGKPDLDKPYGLIEEPLGDLPCWTEKMPITISKQEVFASLVLKIACVRGERMGGGVAVRDVVSQTEIDYWWEHELIDNVLMELDDVFQGEIEDWIGSVGEIGRVLQQELEYTTRDA